MIPFNNQLEEQSNLTNYKVVEIAVPMGFRKPRLKASCINDICLKEQVMYTVDSECVLWDALFVQSCLVVID